MWRKKHRQLFNLFSINIILVKHFFHIGLNKFFLVVLNLIYIYLFPQILSEFEIKDFYFYQSIFSQFLLFDFGLSLGMNIYLQSEQIPSVHFVSSFMLIQLVFLATSLAIFTIILFLTNLSFPYFFIALICINSLSILYRFDNMKGDISKYYRDLNLASLITLMIFLLLLAFKNSSLNFYLMALCVPQLIIFLLHNVRIQRVDPFQLSGLQKVNFFKVFKLASGVVVVTIASLVLNMVDLTLLKSTRDFVEYSQITRLSGIVLIPVSIIFLIRQNQSLNQSEANESGNLRTKWYLNLLASLIYATALIIILQFEVLRDVFKISKLMVMETENWTFNFSLYIFFMTLLIFFSAKDLASSKITIKSLFYLGAVVSSIILKFFIVESISFKMVIILNLILFSILYFIPSVIIDKFTHEKIKKFS